MKRLILAALAFCGPCVLGMSCGASRVRAEGRPSGFAVEMAEVTEAMLAMSQTLAAAQSDGYGLLRSDDFAVYGKFVESKRQEPLAEICWQARNRQAYASRSPVSMQLPGELERAVCRFGNAHPSCDGQPLGEDRFKQENGAVWFTAQPGQGYTARWPASGESS